MYKKIKSVSELEDYSFFFEPKGPKVKNHLARLIEDKGTSVHKLSRVVGIPKQSIYLITEGDYHVGMENALKLSAALDTPLDDMFELSEIAWFEPAKDIENRTIYFDHYDFSIRSGSDMVKFDKNEYLDLKSNTLLKRKKYNELLLKVKKDFANNSNTELTKKEMMELRDNAIDKLETQYIKRFEKLYTKTDTQEINV